MKRRAFVERLGFGSAALAAAGVFGSRASAGALAQNGHDHSQVDGPLASATVSFGQWKTDPPLDRHAGPTPPPTNQHLLIPYMPKIKVGGSVSFIISGLHQVAIYSPGTTLETIDATIVVPSGTGFPPLVADPANRIYRGPNPVPLLPFLDRVEVVTLADPGTYLVICTVLPHFNEGMHGWINVLP